MQRFMSGAGGFGIMYRQAGFEPSAAVQRDGFLESIAGRIYMDAARAPEMFLEGFPFAYDVEELRRSPDASQTPPTLPRGSLVSRWKAARRLAGAHTRLDALSARLERELRETLFEEIAAYVAAAKAVDVASLSLDQLLERWQEHQRWVLEVFGPRLLMPG
jgi:hypothetical protein